MPNPWQPHRLGRADWPSFQSMTEMAGFAPAHLLPRGLKGSLPITMFLHLAAIDTGTNRSIFGPLPDIDFKTSTTKTEPNIQPAEIEPPKRYVNVFTPNWLGPITSANGFSSKIADDSRSSGIDPLLSPSPPCSSSVRPHTPRPQERLWISITGIPKLGDYPPTK
jgi:hypothetical protein